MREQFNAQCSREQLIDTITQQVQAHRTHPDYKNNVTIHGILRHSLCWQLQSSYGLKDMPPHKALKPIDLSDDYSWDDRREQAREAVEAIEALEGATYQQYYDRSDLEETA